MKNDVGPDFLLWIDNEYGYNYLLKFTWKDILREPKKFFQFRYSRWKIDRIVNKWTVEIAPSYAEIRNEVDNVARQRMKKILDDLKGAV